MHRVSLQYLCCVKILFSMVLDSGGLGLNVLPDELPQVFRVQEGLTACEVDLAHAGIDEHFDTTFGFVDGLDEGRLCSMEAEAALVIALWTFLHSHHDGRFGVLAETYPSGKVVVDRYWLLAPWSSQSVPQVVASIAYCD